MRAQEVIESAVCPRSLLRWADISCAPKDRVILVNDTNSADAPFVAARWISDPTWSGWIYQDAALNDFLPLGPAPTAWMDVPTIPTTVSLLDCGGGGEWMPVVAAPLGMTVLVADTNRGFARYVAAQTKTAAVHWVYVSSILAEIRPWGPCPLVWLDVPPVPLHLRPTELSAVAKARQAFSEP